MSHLIIYLAALAWDIAPDHETSWGQCGPYDSACSMTTVHRKFGIRYRVDHGYVERRPIEF